VPARLGSAIVCALLLLVASPALAEDTWTEPVPGVRHMRRVTASQRLHVVKIDLARRDLRLRATRHGDRGRTVSRFARDYGCEIAVNGDFFGSGFPTEGLAIGDGERWPGSADGPRWGFVAAGEDNRVEISLPPLVVEPEAWMREVVGGYPLLVDEGEAAAAVECSTSFCNRNPRTAAGLTRDGRTLILVVVDGRQAGAAGMTLRELAALMIEVDAWRALNFDGGGSSALYIASAGGIVNAPSDGRERTVANHLGIAISPAEPDDPDAGAPASPPDAGEREGDAALPGGQDEAILGAGCSAGGRAATPGLEIALLLVLIGLGRRSCRELRGGGRPAPRLDRARPGRAASRGRRSPCSSS
jgi:hypothetical protein